MLDIESKRKTKSQRVTGERKIYTRGKSFTDREKENESQRQKNTEKGWVTRGKRRIEKGIKIGKGRVIRVRHR